MALQRTTVDPEGLDQAVEYRAWPPDRREKWRLNRLSSVVQWGLEHREIGTLRAIGVDEIHIGQSHKFLTLV